MDISDYRIRINEIDDRLVELFVERMKVSAKIGEYKMQSGMNIYDPKREQEIIDTLSEKAGALYAPYVQALYRDIFDLSRQLQAQLRQISTIEYGLVGRDVSYSYNKWIHHAMGNRNYGLYSMPEEMLPLLFERKSFRGINISAPYKNVVSRWCDRLDPIASETVYVNTIVRQEDGTLVGYNTEYDGILQAVRHAGGDFTGKKVMILGSGSFAAAARAVAEHAGAKLIITVSRTGRVNFGNCYEYKDADILINATPIGMNPDPDRLPVDLLRFPNLSLVVDAVYTPVESRLIRLAKEKEIPVADGLGILIERNAKASELFGFTPDAHIREELYEELTTFIV